MHSSHSTTNLITGGQITTNVNTSHVTPAIKSTPYKITTALVVTSISNRATGPTASLGGGLSTTTIGGMSISTSDFGEGMSTYAVVGGIMSTTHIG